MKALLSIILLLLPASAWAEAWLLHSYKAWEVSLVEGDGHYICGAQTRGADFSFSLLWTPAVDGGFFTVNDDDARWQKSEGKVAIWVDNRPKWSSYASADGDGFASGSLDRDFLVELYSGRLLYIDSDLDGDWNYRFSLAGSAAAMLALSDCIDRID